MSSSSVPSSTEFHGTRNSGLYKLRTALTEAEQSVRYEAFQTPKGLGPGTLVLHRSGRSVMYMPGDWLVHNLKYGGVTVYDATEFPAHFEEVVE